MYGLALNYFDDSYSTDVIIVVGRRYFESKCLAEAIRVNFFEPEWDFDASNNTCFRVYSMFECDPACLLDAVKGLTPVSVHNWKYYEDVKIGDKIYNLTVVEA